MLYGHDKTIHQTTEVNVELDKQGRVVSVWFRCAPLPFTQDRVDDDRAREMDRMYADMEPHKIVAIEFKDE